MIYLAACSRVEAEHVARNYGWRWPKWRYVGSVEHVRGLSPNTLLHVYDGDQVQDVVMRLRGAKKESGASRLAPILHEAHRRGLAIKDLA